MSNISLDLSGKIDPQTVELFSILSETAEKSQIGFFVTGATARDLILEQGFGITIGRKTQDVDFGIMVNGWDVYERLFDTLVSSGYFIREKNFHHRLRFKTHLPIDLIPFGGIESPPGSIAWPPDCEITMKVLGYQDVFRSALAVRLCPKLTIRIASLPGMAILKLIAWEERHNEFPEKDISDLALLLRNYSKAGNQNRIYRDHSEWLEEEKHEIERVEARLLGRDMAVIMSKETTEYLLKILEREVNPDENDTLITSLASQLPGKDYEKALGLLTCLRIGIKGN